MSATAHSSSNTTKQPYRGRFAPSPSGPLHFGSLVTALGSYLEARSQQGQWWVRMEDIDPPREQPGAAENILRALERYQLHWDGDVLYQSTRDEAYETALAQLVENQHSFACGCSRKDIAAHGNGHIYPGICRDGLPTGSLARTVRVRVPDQQTRFIDTLQGQVIANLQTDVGDFVVHRADGLYAYHLAVVVDDAEQGINNIVRGMDLLTSTPSQRYLQQCLDAPHPQYCHLPIATNHLGQKLSKQNQAIAIDTQNPGPTLEKALKFLGHPAPTDLHGANPALLLAWATEHWNMQNVPHTDAICIDNQTK